MGSQIFPNHTLDTVASDSLASSARDRDPETGRLAIDLGSGDNFAPAAPTPDSARQQAQEGRASPETARAREAVIPCRVVGNGLTRR